MARLSLLMAAVLYSIISTAQTSARLFNQQMVLKSCNIKVLANHFVAETFIELEYYNPGVQEIEGRQIFSLKKGQYITGFQLELNGKYRDGSIEEKWKANNAYNTIVGKRVDPAILQQQYDGSFSLNIYPVPARSCRKVKITIAQLMKAKDSAAVYELPLEFAKSADTLSALVCVTGKEDLVSAATGLLKDRIFAGTESGFVLEAGWKNISIDGKSLDFRLFFNPSNPPVCRYMHEGKANFVSSVYSEKIGETTQFNSIHVLWDASYSGNFRNTEKELNFLREIILQKNIKELTIQVFRDSIVSNTKFIFPQHSLQMVANFIRSIKYTGIGSLSTIDFAKIRANLAIVFTSSYDEIIDMPLMGAVTVFGVTSADNYGMYALTQMMEATGGKLIALNSTTTEVAIRQLKSVKSFTCPDPKAQFTYFSGPFTSSHPETIQGVIHTNRNHFSVRHGNNHGWISSSRYVIPDSTLCCDLTSRLFEKLLRIERTLKDYRYGSVFMMGIREKVLTNYTAFIVLERIEDYIKYKIEPPSELVEECAARNYVYKLESRLIEVERKTTEDQMANLVNSFNSKIHWWNSRINKTENAPAADTRGGYGAEWQPLSGKIPGAAVQSFSGSTNTIPEVVVTSAFNTKRTARSVSSSVQHITNEQLNTIPQSDINNALAGKVAGVQVRSQSSVILGRESIIRLRGENGIGVGRGAIYVLDGAIVTISDINVDDIEDVSVLQGPAAAALFGTDGANGAIVVQSKRAKRNGSWYLYNDRKIPNLQEMEDEDYIAELNSFDKNHLQDGYEELSKIYGKNPAFHFDVAELLFKENKAEAAKNAIYNGIEVSGNFNSAMRSAAYLLESCGDFDEAIVLYKRILKSGKQNLAVMRDLALAYYQHNRFQESLEIFSMIVNPATPGQDDYGIRQLALAEMNALIYAHRNSLDFSKTDTSFYRELPVDLRISATSSTDHANFIMSGPGSPDSVHIYAGLYYVRTGSPNVTPNKFETNDEVMVRHGVKGKYKFYYQAYNYHVIVPSFRLVIIRNYNQPGQTLEIHRMNMQNQYGLIQVNSIDWE